MIVTVNDLLVFSWKNVRTELYLLGMAILIFYLGAFVGITLINWAIHKGFKGLSKKG